MTYNALALIIPSFAAVYVLVIYLLLGLAEHTTKNSGYVTNSFTDAYISYLPKEPKEPEQKMDEVESSPRRNIQQVTIVR
ncbi:MAG: hypothetical protein F6K31_04050 [Symploca sp. SIO2G7]|nr:hypothetical protein [Symploca sp. SIO2G7]